MCATGKEGEDRNEVSLKRQQSVASVGEDVLSRCIEELRTLEAPPAARVPLSSLTHLSIAVKLTEGDQQ
jgi:hypothetical protein